MSYLLASNDCVRRIAELKRDDMPFIIRLEDGRNFADAGGSVEIDVSASRQNFDPNLDDVRRWTKIG